MSIYGFHFDVTTMPPSAATLDDCRSKLNTQLLKSHRRERVFRYAISAAISGFAAIWLTLAVMGVVSDAHLITGAVAISIMMISLSAFSFSDDISAGCGIIGFCSAVAIYGGVSLGVDSSFDAAYTPWLVGSAIGVICTLAVCSLWAYAVPDDDETRNSLRIFDTLNINAYPDECIAFSEWCTENPVIRRYQNALAADGRMPVMGEYEAARIFFRGKYPAYRACQRLAHPV